MYRSILVPLDGSPFAEHALPLAREVARRTGVSLQILHVIPPFPVIDAGAPLLAALGHGLRPAPTAAQFQAQARAYLDGVLQRLGGTPPVPAAPVVLEGEVVTQGLSGKGE
jgi:nucleotide-binding universal stress UspA family protein